MGAHFSCAPGGTGLEKLRTRPAVPAPSAPRAMGAAARTTSATKVPVGAWGTSGLRAKLEQTCENF